MKFKFLKKFGLCLPVSLLASCQSVWHTKRAKPLASSLLPGDVLFQDSGSPQCFAVKLASRSKWSHCGLVLPKNGQLMVLEAVQPVCWTPIEDWKNRAPGGILEVRRYRAQEKLTDPVVAKMVALGESMVGRNYDALFQWSDDEIYCSELVWKIYQRALGVKLGALQPLRSFDLSHPEVQMLMQARYGSHPPLAEPVISPEALRMAPQLTEVAFPPARR